MRAGDLFSVSLGSNNGPLHRRFCCQSRGRMHGDPVGLILDRFAMGSWEPGCEHPGYAVSLDYSPMLRGCEWQRPAHVRRGAQPAVATCPLMWRVEETPTFLPSPELCRYRLNIESVQEMQDLISVACPVNATSPAHRRDRRTRSMHSDTSKPLPSTESRDTHRAP